MESVLFKVMEASQLAAERLAPSRERSMVLTKLDEARLWIKECQPINPPLDPKDQIPDLDAILKDAPSEIKKDLGSTPKL